MFCNVFSKKKLNFSSKKSDLKKAQNLRLFKGVSPWFLPQKLKLFPCFVLMQNRAIKSVL